MRKMSVRRLTEAGVIAAAYAALCLFLAPFSFGGLQFRAAEALTVLPYFTPAAIPGLTIGCIIANLWSPYGLIDIVFGSLATLIASLCTRQIAVSFKGRGGMLLAPLPPVLTNAVIVGGVLTAMTAAGEAWLPIYLTMAAEVGFSELVVCYALGLPLMLALRQTKNAKISHMMV